MNTTLDGAAVAYADAVRGELVDLPDDEVAEIVDDVRDHLEQVAAELGGSPSPEMFAERLGTPAAYAAELRQAAGFPERSAAGRSGGLPLRVLRFLVTWIIRAAAALTVVSAPILLADGGPWAAPFVSGALGVLLGIGLWVVVRGPSRDLRTTLTELSDGARLKRLYDRTAATGTGAATTEFVVSLRPAWWVVRGWVAASLIVIPLGHAAAFPLVRSVEGAAALVAAVVASVWWGRRTARSPLCGWPRLGQLVGNTLLAVAAPVVLFSIGEPAGQGQDWYEPAYDGFYHRDGTPIINLFPYGPDGRLLEGIRLYDQDGRPIDNVWWIEWDSDCALAAETRPGNVFPRPLFELDWDTGRCVEVEFAAPFGSVLPGRQ